MTGRLPTVRCDVCGDKIAYKPGEKTASQALEDHYRKKGHI